MLNSAPPIDPRTEKEIARQVQSLVAAYAPAWKEFDPSTQQPQGVSAALIGIFARYASIIIQRLNRAPDKNFLAFLDLLGASLLPPEPARAPLTFFLAAGSAVDAVVPPGTQVAAPPAEGESEPVIFETERELVVTSAQLVSLLARSPAQDQYADRGAILSAPSGTGVSAFDGNLPLDHILYIGSELFGFAQMDPLDLTFDLTSGFASAPNLIWEFWDGSGWQPNLPSDDETTNLTQAGEHNVTFTEVKAIPISAVNSRPSRWVRCRLATPVAPAGQAGEGVVSADQLPRVDSISVAATPTNSGLAPANAFTNLLPVDLSKDFFPFGEKPKFGDTLYLASDEAFSQAGATITLHVTLTDPAKAGTPNPKDNASTDLELTWETWNGAAWTALGTSTLSGPASGPFTDTTNAFTAASHAGDVTCTLPSSLASTTVNGVTSYWIRVRLSRGNYGLDARYVQQGGSYTYSAATFAPPSIRQITLSYVGVRTLAPQPDYILTYNDFKYDAPTGPFAPFRATQDPSPALYLGFTLPSNRSAFPNLTLSLYFRLADILYGQPADNPAPGSSPRLVWEYWNGSDWSKLVVNDETDALTHSGLVQLLPPADFAPSAEFGLTRYWLRVRWDSGDYKFVPRLRSILLNTTTAAQTLTLANEALGSSNGSANQAFRATRAPVLQNQQLTVREPELPSSDEQETIQTEEGEDAVSIVLDAAGRPQEIWVRWHEVPDFYASGPRDRHYVLDHLTGEIRFGDGITGLIPPIGTGNIRMARYQTGGGVRGNRAAATIVQLKTTVPYVDKVINSDAASGGADAESLDSLLARAPRTIRHRDRAVTLEDYEDLALLASPQVARARCDPLYDLAADPDATQQLPGTVSVIIVPRSASPKPEVSLALIEQVQSYLEAHRVPTSDLVVVGPDYVRVDVQVEIALTSLDVARDVEMAVTTALSSFLHPLTGGLDGAGWGFGRQPHKSDVYVLLESLPGVDHVRTLNLTGVPDRPKADQTDHFLVYPGAISTSLIFEQT